VDDVEETTLPQLRDELVRVSNPANRDQARYITEHLLIDASTDGCQTTTRVAQAIETIQGMLFGLRTGQWQEPRWSFVAPYFDDEWTWLGSYATWRAAMFVFLYPENVLLSTLRQRQTPMFLKLVDELRNDAQVTPEDACQAGKAYSQYFGDILGLSVV